MPSSDWPSGNPRTLSVGDLQRLHDEALQRTGGCPGVLDLQRLEAASARPLTGVGDTELFPTILDKAAALAHSIATAHPFVDGNKRTALLAAQALLEQNGLLVEAPGRLAEAELLRLATGRASLRSFAGWLRKYARPM